MVNDTVNTLTKLGFAAEPAINPANGNSCAWVAASEAAAVNAQGLVTWDAHGYVILELSAVLRRRAADFIGLNEAESMLQQIKSAFPRLVAETVPKTVSLFMLTDVLRVTAYQEVTPDIKIQILGRISLDGFSPRAGVSVGGVPLWTS